MIHDSGKKSSDPANKIVLEEMTDPVELAKAAARRVQNDRNFAWFQTHAQEVYDNHQGKCICIAGEELFVGDTPREVFALATAAHPEDKGRFVLTIPKQKLRRIYAKQR